MVMVKEHARKCSHCGQNGHNSRTCNNNYNVLHRNGINGNTFKLFGVTIMEKGSSVTMMEKRSSDSIMEKRSSDSIMKKSVSMDNLSAACSGGQHDGNDVVDHEAGYLSDGLIDNKKRKAALERKRGKPWTEEEHRTFLTGLNKLGKGDWRGIAMKYVTTRTPSQVASHAQKYFLRLVTSNDKKKRRSSVFDMPFQKDDVAATQQYYAETSSQAGKSLVLAENQPTDKLTPEILNRFPHLCLDNYPSPVPATAASASRAAPIYQLVPYGVGIPGRVQPWPMINLVRPSFLQNSVPNVNSFAPVMSTHPSGIPPPRSAPSSPSKAVGEASPADQRDGLELKIGPPQSKQGQELSSPASGAIKVT